MENSEDRRARVDPEINRPLNSLDVTPLRKSRTPLEIFKKVGIPIIAAVLILATIIVVAVLIKVILDSYFFFCGQPLLFIPREQVCDGHQDCASGEDEKYCVKKLPDGPPVAVRLSRDRSTLQVLNPATKNWASACFDSFTEALAKTACRQMGYDSVQLAVPSGKDTLPPSFPRRARKASPAPASPLPQQQPQPGLLAAAPPSYCRPANCSVSCTSRAGCSLIMKPGCLQGFLRYLVYPSLIEGETEA